ncbi:MAG: hypothetical protein FWH18_02385 [Marinilabiliaceae bacterium]|nr:hypothetical protein [Marinilabiliaceae bacterium]
MKPTLRFLKPLFYFNFFICYFISVTISAQDNYQQTIDSLVQVILSSEGDIKSENFNKLRQMLTLPTQLDIFLKISDDLISELRKAITMEELRQSAHNHIHILFAKR